MIGEYIRGWCIEWDERQVPDVFECECQRSGTEMVYVQVVDTDEERIYRSYAFGETFFFHLPPALTKHLSLLEEAKKGHEGAVAYIRGQMDVSRALLNAEDKRKEFAPGPDRPPKE